MQRQTVPAEIELAITTTETTRVSLWRARAIAFLRIAFGLIWAIDAWFKWQPGFISSFTDQITKAKQDQPQGVQSWHPNIGKTQLSRPRAHIRRASGALPYHGPGRDIRRSASQRSLCRRTAPAR